MFIHEPLKSYGSLMCTVTVNVVYSRLSVCISSKNYTLGLPTGIVATQIQHAMCFSLGLTHGRYVDLVAAFPFLSFLFKINHSSSHILS